MKRSLAVAIFIVAAWTSAALADADQDWQRIEQQEKKPPGEFQSRDEARQLTLRQLEQQEAALRGFARNYPADPRSFEANLRLAHLLAVRGDLEPNPQATADATALLESITFTAPAERAADLAFAKVSLSMRNTHSADSETAVRLLKTARMFQKAFPRDRRVGPLLAEVATLFDFDPKRMGDILQEADALSTDPEVKSRIADDLKRIAFVGQVIELRFKSTDGRAFDVAKYQGKAVVICWFADWSPPSMLALRGLSASMAKSRRDVQCVGISLDTDRAALAANVKALGLDWPVACDGKGWASPLARSFGINGLPTVWLLDRAGKLRSLNFRGDPAAMLRP